MLLYIDYTESVENHSSMIIDGVCYPVNTSVGLYYHVWYSPLVVSLLSDVNLGWYFRPETSIDVSCVSSMLR